MPEDPEHRRPARSGAAGRKLALTGVSLLAVVAVVLLATMLLLVVLYDPSLLAPDLAAVAVSGR